MSFIDATVVNVALPALQADLHATITEVQWVIEAYALFLGALILVGGWLIEHVSWRAVFFLNVPFAAAVIVLSLRFIAESHDRSRSGRIDWTGAMLAVGGLGGIVFGLLEWPRRGPDAVVIGTMVAGAVSIVLFVIVERHAATPMLPLTLFRSRRFTLTNLLTLLLYAALGITLFIVPMNLIQVQHYTATAAGAAFLPFSMIMFALSRWSGGLVARTGSRLPLTIGPILAAAGLALYAWPGIGGSYWTTFFPAVVVLGFGMAITVAPLTTTVMGAVEREHAGVASGINNAVSRVAGLLAVAVFGVIFVRTFDARARTSLDGLKLPSPERTAVDRELSKVAGAEVEPPVRAVIDEACVSAFRVVIIAAP